MKVAKYVPLSYANAPGPHAVVWFQGCRRGCPGCINQAMQPGGPGYPHTHAAHQLLNEILRSGLHSIRGVVLTGGEPLDQSTTELLELCRGIKRAGLGLTIYTGWTRAEIAADRWLCRLFALADLMICGPYQQDNEEPCQPLCGSGNQELLLSGFYGYAELLDVPAGEILIDADGSITTGTGL